MGAWKAEAVVGSRNEHSTDNVPSLTAFVSPDSSFSSTSSLCEKGRTYQSPPRLRRSTLDLSQLKSSGILRSLQDTTSVMSDNKQVETKKREAPKESTVSLVTESMFHYVSVLQTLALVEASIRLFLGEAHHHVGNVLGFLLNSIIINNSHASGEILAGDHSWTNNFTEDDDDDVPSDPPFSPAKVTAAPTADPKDEWGHFADFQEEPVEDAFLVKPRFPALSALSTLDEQDDCEGDDEAFSF